MPTVKFSTRFMKSCHLTTFIEFGDSCKSDQWHASHGVRLSLEKAKGTLNNELSYPAFKPLSQQPLVLNRRRRFGTRKIRLHAQGFVQEVNELVFDFLRCSMLHLVGSTASFCTLGSM